MDETRVLLLGPVEVEVAGRRVALERRQERCLLAVLALEHGRMVPVERLGDLLWDGDPPQRFRSILYTQACRVRSALRTVGAEDWLSTGRGGYLMRSPAGSVDVDRFRDLARQARACREPVERGRLWRAGLGLWRGPALADVGSARLRRRMCGQLDELRLVATEEWLAAWLDAGRFADAVGELARLTGEHPLRERLFELYLRALAGSGRQAEALQAYDEYRGRLAEELGLDPGPGLTHARLAVLRGGSADGGPGTAGEGVTSAPGEEEVVDVLARRRVVGVRPGQLPHDVIDFTGRDPESRRIRDQLSRRAGNAAATVVISAVAGRAGIGKTALAVHVAHLIRDEYPDGQLFANLHGAQQRPAEPGEVLAQFLRALGIPGEAVPDALEERSAMYRSLLADRRVLVVLDNAADEAQVRDLIPGTATAGVLVTSRRRLSGLPGASLLHLDVLDDPHAAELLRRIIGADRIAAEPDATGWLVRLCAGLPLALRVTGARLAARPHWSLAHMAQRLAAEHRRLDELAHADLEVRASLALSYRGLDERSRRLLRRLALLDAPDFPGWVAAAVMDADDEEGSALVDRLVEVHLLDVAGSDRVGQVRYRFHDLVRLFGRERSREEDPESERTAALARALGGLLVLTQQAHLSCYGETFSARLRDAPRWAPDEIVCQLVSREPMEWLQAERVALISSARQAGDAGLAATCWELAAASFELFSDAMCADDVCTMSRYALAAARSAGSRHGEALALLGLGHGLTDHYRVAEAYESLARAEQIFTQLANRYGQASASWRLAWIERYRGEPKAALARYRQAAAILHEAGEKREEINVLYKLGRLYMLLERPDDALRMLREAQSLASQVDKPCLKAQVAHALGLTYLELGLHAHAERVLQSALAGVRSVGVRAGEVTILTALGQVALGSGDVEHAAVRLEESLRLNGAASDRYVEIKALRTLGELHVAEGDLAAAAEMLGQAYAVADQIQSPLRAQVLGQLADVYETAGDQAAADAARAEAAGAASGEKPPGGSAG